MKRYRLFIILFLTCCKLNAQVISYDYSWPFGQGSGIGTKSCNLNFASGSPVVDTVDRIMALYATVGSISDQNGAIKFSSNGCFVLNSADDTLQNGSGLNPNNCTNLFCQSGLPSNDANLILPDPGNAQRFFLFHAPCSQVNVNQLEFLYYSIIDMTLDSGRGAVVNKNTLINPQYIIGEFMTATKHGNGRDWWIICHGMNSDLFYEYLLTPAGVQGPFNQHCGWVFDNPGWGNVRFSHDGSKLICGSQYAKIRLFDFDRCTGLISANVQFSKPYPNDFCFISTSQDSHFLYSVDLEHIIQYDLTAPNIDSTAIIVATYDGFIATDSLHHTYFSAPQLAVDGKIYFPAYGGTNYMHIIDQPEQQGLACNVIQHAIELPCALGFPPNFPNYRLGALTGSTCDSLVIDGITSIPASNLFHIYPNPVKGEQFTISYPQLKQDVQLEIYNLFGSKLNETILPSGSWSMKISVENLSGGVYFACLRNSKTSELIKFFVAQ
ncbi:MAG: T9SS type A sorting domain-containing protein [Saprospiraceae bacterium]|nr:T9SS type A sorting domain-containing protein [Bacteroidia bacterium]MBP6521916.1 T9SS type A sorting domain-containing protein [Saprospiraceae bacterium]